MTSLILTRRGAHPQLKHPLSCAVQNWDNIEKIDTRARNEAENLVHFFDDFSTQETDFISIFVAAQRNLIKIIKFPSRYHREFQEYIIYFDHYKRIKPLGVIMDEWQLYPPSPALSDMWQIMLMWHMWQ